MKTIKIGQINFLVNNGIDSGEYLIKEQLCDKINRYSSNYKFEYVEDCYNNECDIVFYSLWGALENLKRCKGNPIFIYYTIENTALGEDKDLLGKLSPFEYYRNNNYSISFYDDSPTNCFYPYFIVFSWLIKWKTDYNKKIYSKDLPKFCAFVAKNSNWYNANFRTELVKKLMNYKKVDCWGPVLNNTNGNYLPFFYEDSYKIMKDYKFYISFENEYSTGNLSYITEKIMWPYFWRCIPVYWGCERITEWFNPESFINCNGMSYEEIINKIIEVDNNNDMATYMLNQYPFKDPYIDYETMFDKKLTAFIENILQTNISSPKPTIILNDNVNNETKSIDKKIDETINTDNYMLWCTYHDNSIIDKFHIKNSEHFKLLDLSKEDTGENDNVNLLNVHLSELPSLYYIWKNQIKSDIVGFCQYRRHFNYINFDRISKGEVQVYKKWELSKETRYDEFLDIGIGEYVTYMFMKYMFEKRPNVDKDKVRSYIYGNKLTISNKDMFICKWDIFCDICDFIFGFLEYIVPNGDWKNAKSLVECATDLKALDDIFAKSLHQEGEDHRWVTLKADGRQMAAYMEWLIGTYINMMYDTFVEEWESKYIRKKIYLRLDDKDIPKLKTWYESNIFSGISDFYIQVSYKNDPKKFLCNSEYHLWYNYEFVHWLTYDESYPEDVIKLNIDEYIDVTSPIEFYKTGEYKIEKIKYDE